MRCLNSSTAALAGDFIGSNLMGWFVAILALVIGIPVFTWAYRRRLDVLTGPWIADKVSRND